MGCIVEQEGLGVKHCPICGQQAERDGQLQCQCAEDPRDSVDTAAEAEQSRERAQRRMSTGARAEDRAEQRRQAGGER